MGLARIIYKVAKQREKIQDEIITYNYKTLYKKYYGNLKTISNYINIHYYYNVKLSPLYKRGADGKYRRIKS